MDPDQRRALETILEISDELHRLARASGSDLLAHLLDQARREARSKLGASPDPLDAESGSDTSAAARNTRGRG
jgi:hypothetical protein